MKEAQAIERLRQVIRRQHKALATEDAYVLWLRRYIKALAQMPAQLASEKKLEMFLTDLAKVHDVSASTQNQAFNARRAPTFNESRGGKRPRVPRPPPSTNSRNGSVPTWFLMVFRPS